MQIQQKRFSEATGWVTIRDDGAGSALYNLVLVFSTARIIADPAVYASIKCDFPNADILLNSTAGEISDIKVTDNSISLTAIYFEKTKLKTATADIACNTNSFEAGKKLAADLDAIDLKYVLVISDGQFVNGSGLVCGLQQDLPDGTLITGGLAGDGGRFSQTLVGLNEVPVAGRIAVIGFYGNKLTVTFGSIGGWDSFGPERLVTRSEANVLFELDGKPALDIYKMYLGEYACELPESGLLFPLSIRTDDKKNSQVRTILSVNEDNSSLTFAGNMPEGSYARLMKANLDRLIEGAADAANDAARYLPKSPDLALLISCFGRRLVLDQRVEEEVEVVRAIYGESTAITGFYSYGEISPSFNFTKCELHNQTMTITTFTEE